MSQPLDVIILGAGSAGLAALREVRKRTDHWRIVNDGPWGTTCARVGCMPSKMLIEAANAYHARRALHTFGIEGADALRVDLPAVLRRVRALRDDFVAGTLAATDAGERAISGHARLLDAQRVEVNGQVHTARRIIIATGSRPIVPEDWLAFGDRILTTDTLFEQPTLGPRVAVIGLGPLGVEIAQALARLGVEVMAFATGKSVAGLSDPAINDALLARLKDEFIVNVGDKAELCEVAGGIQVTNGSATVVVDQVVAAMGRTPNIEHLGLETLGEPLDEKGMPHVDRQTQQIGKLRVFLAGDANDDAALLHEGADEGHIAGMNALAAEPTRFVRRVPLAIVFCDPNVAVVGVPFSQLDPAHTVVGAVDFDSQGRARAALRNQGRLCVYADKGSARLLGAEMCAPGGEHLAHLLALAVQQKLTVHQLLGMPIYHPVLEEGLRTALRNAARHLPDASASDLAACTPIGVAALE